MRGIILGNPNSVFVYRQAQFFIENGVEVKVLTYHDGPDEVNAVDSGIDYESIVEVIDTKSIWGKKLKKTGVRVEKKVSKLFKKTNENIFEHLILAFALRRTIINSKPDFIFGHNLISYGIATCLAPKAIRKYVMPYGGDVFYIDKHPLRFRLLRLFVNRLTGMFPTAEYGRSILLQKFKVSPDVVEVISWGVNLKRFNRDNKSNDKQFILEYFNIDIGGDVDIVLNIRRFRPNWGCIEALEVAKKIVAKRRNLIFIFIGGSGADQEIVNEAISGLSPEESKQIHFLGERISEDILNKVINSSTIFTSLLKVEEMRSSSILEGIAASSVPVVTRCQEYENMEKFGFSPVYVSLDINEIVCEIVRLLDDQKRMDDIVVKNFTYVSNYENSETQMRILMQNVVEY